LPFLLPFDHEQLVAGVRLQDPYSMVGFRIAGIGAVDCAGTTSFQAQGLLLPIL
jgi:hypothetical protein